jgi:uncharacterized protein (TIGR00251 family)
MKNGKGYIQSNFFSWIIILPLFNGHKSMRTYNKYIQPQQESYSQVGLHGDTIKIKLASPPIDGRANEALIKYLATQFDCPLRGIKVIRGEKSRFKTVTIDSCTLDPNNILYNCD